MKIAVVMPCKWMHFSPKQATSSELTVHDILTHTLSNHNITVYAQTVNSPYSDIPVRFYPRGHKSDDRQLSTRIALDLKESIPEIIVVQQHLPTSVKLNRYLPSTPILLHRHNDYDPPHRNFIRRWIQQRRFKSIDGIALVSEHSRQHFLKSWKKYVSFPTFVVPNGIDLSIWKPVEYKDRKDEIIFVGRAIPEKGALELAKALAHVLQIYPHFSARFIFGAPDTHPEYRKQIERILSKFNNQIQINYQISWQEIQSAFQTSAIAVVPSIWDEPFGRTALEAMAGGAALISSTRGGLNEVVGDAAVRLTDITPDTIAAALTDLIDHPEKRATLSARGLEQAKKFTIEAQVEAFLSACRATIDRKANKAVRR